MIRKDIDIMDMRRRHDPHFESIFAQGYRRYLAGDWARAEDTFLRCLRMNPHDGPSRVL